MEGLDQQTLILEVNKKISAHSKKVRDVNQKRIAADMILDEEVKRPMIVLRSETLVELGGPGRKSFGHIVCTEEKNLVKDNEILLLGQDFAELKSGTYSWGILILTEGQNLEMEDYYNLSSYILPPGLFEGVMLKHSRDSLWCRISGAAFDVGLSCAELGKKIISHIKTNNSHVEKVSVLFVISDESDLNEFTHIIGDIQIRQKEIRKKFWDKRGVDILACVPGGHCGSCKSKDTCNEVRKMYKEYKQSMEVCE